MLKSVKKCFTIYFSVYNMHPFLELKSGMIAIAQSVSTLDFNFERVVGGSILTARIGQKS